MNKKILAAIVSVSLVMMIICAGLVMAIIYDYLGEKIDDELSDQAILVEEAWRLEGDEFLDVIERRTDITSRITLISPTGKVLYDSMADSEQMENHLEREEVKEAITNGVGKAMRTSNTLAKTTRYYALKTSEGNVIRLSTTHYSQLGFFLDTFGMIVVAVAILLVVGFIISQRVTSAILKPINRIDLDNPDVDEHYEELGPLLHRIHQQNKKITRQMEELKKSREEFQIITGHMTEGIVVVNRQGKILSYNKSAADKLDFRIEEKEDAPESALKMNRTQAFRTAIEEALNGRNYHGTMDSHGMILEIIGSPVMEDGDVSGAIIMVIDVTEKERGEKLRREFTSNVSHELKTPVTSIYGIADMLAGGMVKNEDVRRFSQNIKDEAGRLIILIEDILKLSQLDEASFAKEMAPVDLRAITENVIERLMTNAEKNNIKINFEFLDIDGNPENSEEAKALIMGQENIVDEIVYNICENAVKYNRIGGNVRVSLNAALEEWTLTVRDDGIGIPKSELNRVFERFYRVDKSHSKKIGGTGLGLSIVKHGVSYLGGTVTIGSEENEGTVVCVRFPKI